MNNKDARLTFCLLHAHAMAPAAHITSLLKASKLYFAGEIGKQHSVKSLETRTKDSSTEHEEQDGALAQVLCRP